MNGQMTGSETKDSKLEFVEKGKFDNCKIKNNKIKLREQFVSLFEKKNIYQIIWLG